MASRVLLAIDVLLVLVAGGLGFELYRVWTAAPTAATSRPAPAPPSAAHTGPGPAPALPALGPLSAFVPVAERNLFSPTRTEAMPEPPRPTAATAPTPPPGPKPRLYGVVLGGNGGAAKAYLEDPRTRKVFGYTTGDTVADSRVEQIRADRVVLRRGAEVFEVLLRDPSKPKPAPVPTAPGTRVPGRPVPPGIPGQVVPGMPGTAIPGQVVPFPGTPTLPGGAAQPAVPDDDEEGAAPVPITPPAPFVPGVPGQPAMPPGVTGPGVPPTPGVGPRRPPIRVPRGGGTYPTPSGQPAPHSAGDTGS